MPAQDDTCSKARRSWPPGEADRVVLGLESDLGGLRRGEELQILERDERVVGHLTVLRICTSL